MQIEGNKVIFWSTAEHYALEKSGQKPCTIRLMTTDEHQRILSADPKFIEIRTATSGAGVLRTLSWWGIIDMLLGKLLVVFCWER